MKVSDIKATYYEASESLSAVARQLAFAGIAVVWVIRVGDQDAGGLQYADSLLLPLVLFVGSLACDLLQYAYKSIAWGLANTVKWKQKGADNADVTVSGKINYPTIAFFWAKVALCAVAYVLLGLDLISQLRA